MCAILARDDAFLRTQNIRNGRKPSAAALSILCRALLSPRLVPSLLSNISGDVVVLLSLGFRAGHRLVVSPNLRIQDAVGTLRYISDLLFGASEDRIEPFGPAPLSRLSRACAAVRRIETCCWWLRLDRWV